MWGQIRRMGWSTNLARRKMRSNGKNRQLNGIYCMLVTLLGVLHSLTHCIFITTAPWYKYCLIGWETCRLHNVPKITWIVSGRAGIQSQVWNSNQVSKFKSTSKIQVVSHCGLLPCIVELTSERWSGGILEMSSYVCSKLYIVSECA